MELPAAAPLSLLVLLKVSKEEARKALEELDLVVSPVEVYAHRDRSQVSREVLEELAPVVSPVEVYAHRDLRPKVL